MTPLRRSMTTVTFPMVVLGYMLLLPIILSYVGASFPVSNGSHLINRATESAEQCGFQGDDNTYGLGIRLGVYLSWVTTSIAYNFVPEEAVTMRGVNNCFQLSLFAALIYITKTGGSTLNAGGLYSAEVWVVLMLAVGGVCTGKGAKSHDEDEEGEKTFASYQASTIGGVVQLFITAGIIFYGIWFIYIGMDNMLHPPCSQAAFFFAKVSIFHWYRKFLKAFFTIGGILSGAGLVITMVSIFFACVGSGISKSLAWITDFHEEKDAEKFESERLSLSNTSFSLALPWFITAVELTIRWNHIEGVNSLGSTGQLLPLIVAAAGLVRVCWKFLIKAARGDYAINTDNHKFSFLCCSYSSRTTYSNNYSMNVY